MHRFHERFMRSFFLCVPKSAFAASARSLLFSPLHLHLSRFFRLHLSLHFLSGLHLRVHLSRPLHLHLSRFFRLHLSLHFLSGLHLRVHLFLRMHLFSPLRLLALPARALFAISPCLAFQKSIPNICLRRSSRFCAKIASNVMSTRTLPSFFCATRPPAHAIGSPSLYFVPAKWHLSDALVQITALGTPSSSTADCASKCSSFL